MWFTLSKQTNKYNIGTEASYISMEMLIILMSVLQTYLDPVRFPREQELSDAETECKGKLKQHQDFHGM